MRGVRGRGGVVLGTLELRVRGWSADYDATSRRSEWNSERKKVMKRRGPRLPACPVRAAPPRWLPGTGKTTWVRWRRVGGAADAAFGSPRASRLPWKREGLLQAAWKPGIPGETALWESGRACPSGLLGIPSAPLRTCAPFCLPFQGCLLPRSSSYPAKGNTPCSQADQFQGKSVPGTVRVETKCLLLQRGIHVLYLQCGSLQTHTKSVGHVLVLGTNFICIA